MSNKNLSKTSNVEDYYRNNPLHIFFIEKLTYEMFVGAIRTTLHNEVGMIFKKLSRQDQLKILKEKTHHNFDGYFSFLVKMILMKNYLMHLRKQMIFLNVCMF